ncbi:MAG: hypothetical protein A2104_09925, partial [Candidatus Melainabacteria bacterium GWF2_32_7]
TRLIAKYRKQPTKITKDFSSKSLMIFSAVLSRSIPLKVVGYVNSYKTHKDDRFLEIKSQKEKISEFCQKHNLELVKIYEETINNADFPPVLTRLINDAANKNFEHIVVLKIDILAKDNLTKTWVTSELNRHNIRIYSIAEFNASKPSTASISESKLVKYKVKDIPSLPEVVTKVMELVQNPNSSAAQLSKVISHDTGLTSRVLKLVNSAYYGFPKQISSIQHAIMILGFTTIRGLVLSSTIFKIFAPKNDRVKVLDYKRLWKHSLITAIAAKRINKFLRLQEDDDIFSSAILHDIGKIILDQYDHENYISALQEAPHPMDNRMMFAEKRYCGINHQDLGYLVAEEWNLPPGLINVIHYHHYPLEALEHTQLTSIVYVGNIIAHIALDFDNFDIGLFDERVLEYLSLDEDNLCQINSEVMLEIENIEDLESFLR